MKHIKLFEQFLNEKKPKGAPDWHDSDAPDAEGRFKDLSPKDLAAWLIKTRDKDLKKISGSINQQIVFNRKKDPKYAEKMEKTREEVYKQLGRTDLMEGIERDGEVSVDTDKLTRKDVMYLQDYLNTVDADWYTDGEQLIFKTDTLDKETKKILINFLKDNLK